MEAGEKTKYVIKDVTIAELAFIMPEVCAHYKKHYSDYWDIKPMVAIHAWKTWLSDPSGSNALLGAFDETTGDLMGIIGCSLMYDPYHYSGDLECHDRLWYVLEKYRSTGVGVQLLDAMREWGKARGAKRVLIGFMCGHNQDKMISMLAKHGYKTMQFSAAKEV